jgi:aspartyl-tRNA(Asn)/glutamyl-tRNA(Gln) amidotransferase subunit B
LHSCLEHHVGAYFKQVLEPKALTHHTSTGGRLLRDTEIQEAAVEITSQVMGELGGWIESTDATRTSAGDILDQQKTQLAKLAGGWLTSKFAGLLAEAGKNPQSANISAENFAEFLHLLYTQKINSANGQKLLALMLETGLDPSHLMEEHDLGQSMDDDALKTMIRRLIEENPDQVAQIKAGKISVIKWFVGGVMKATEGKANPAQAETIVKRELGM